MRAVLVYLSDTLPSSRIRVVQAVPHLHEAGVEAQAVRYPRTSREWGALRALARDCDVVMLQKKLLGPLEARKWRSLGRPVVFDFDDAIMFRDHEPFLSRRRAREFRRSVGVADAVVAGNGYLRSQITGVDDLRVLVLPSPVPHQVPLRWDQPQNTGPLTLGWVGGSKNLGSLEMIAGALAEVSRGHEVVLHILSDAPCQLPNVSTRHTPWSLAGQDAVVSTFDVGLMPLADTPWSKGKCAYKALQYMAAGVPVIASPVGMNVDVITHQENGWLADSAQDWVEGLRRLLGSSELRNRLGRAGRATIERGFTYPKLAAELANFLGSVAA